MMENERVQVTMKVDGNFHCNAKLVYLCNATIGLLRSVHDMCELHAMIHSM